MGLYLALLAALAAPQDSDDPAADHLTGDLGGFQSWCADRSLRFELLYTAEVFFHAHGEDGDPRYLGDVSLFLEAAPWAGGTAFVHLQEHHGEGIGTVLGNALTVSNLDSEPFRQVSEAWVRQEFLSGALWLKAGKMDANRDFGGTDGGAIFLNGAAGYSPTIPLTTFPEPDWGAVAGVDPLDWFSARAGIFHGIPDGRRLLPWNEPCGPVVLGEVVFTHSTGALRCGGWWNGEDRRRGGYLTGDQALGAHLDAFVQVGWLEQERFVGLGLTVADALGLAAFHGQAETVVELTYRAEVKKWLVIRPDVQIVVRRDVDPALALGVRVELRF